MRGWRLLESFFLLHITTVLVVKPQCIVCPSAGLCVLLDNKTNVPSNATIMCRFNGQNYTRDENSNVNLSVETVNGAIGFLYNVTYNSRRVVLSTNYSRKLFDRVQYLNFSHNAVTKFIGNFDNLTFLDLSHNLLENISSIRILSTKLISLVLNANNLKTLSNFSHENLQQLEVRMNQINNLELGKLPKLKFLHLGDNRISDLKKANFTELVPRLEILNLTSNDIAQLNDYNFNLSSLLRLYLSNNSISYLSEKCFYGLNKLQYLDISCNRITTVFPSMFQYIPLVQLIVSDNPHLMTQDFGILLASERLKSVNASKTNQNKIPSCLTRSIRYLSLTHNAISQIQCGDLDSYPLLNSLDLSFNNISYIEDDALGRLELLESIILSYNRLTQIPYTFPNDIKLLFLDHNQLTKIMPSDFTGLVKLKRLQLSGNNISLVLDSSFSQMYGLISLNLSSNPMSNVSIGTFSGPHKLKILDLSNLTNLTKCNQDICFPVPEPNGLSELYIQGSPELGYRLMRDVAALKTFEQLNVLNMENCQLSNVNDDLSNYFPRLRYLQVKGNALNCSEMREQYAWLGAVEVSECTYVIYEKMATTEPQYNRLTTINPKLSTGITPDIAHQREGQSGSGAWSETNDGDKQTQSVRYSEDAEVISNEIWISDDQLGIADSYSAEKTPSSHPGLFVMLLLPLALAGAVLFIRYSQLKRREWANDNRKRDIDIEISNISSELW